MVFTRVEEIVCTMAALEPCSLTVPQNSSMGSGMDVEAWGSGFRIEESESCGAFYLGKYFAKGFY
jgi:hypothetical protein